MPTTLLKIDPSNIGDHYYLQEENECFFFYEYTARQGYAHSPGNQFVSNLKKSVLLRGSAQYHYKEQDITRAGIMLHMVLKRAPDILPNATVCPIPPSKIATHPEYDDRIARIVAAACRNTAAEARELIVQTESYESSHTQASGQRKKPEELEAIYRLVDPAPRPVVILVDDVLTTGAHFVAARNVILARYPKTQVVGMFLARRALPNPFDDFDAQ